MHRFATDQAELSLRELDAVIGLPAGC